MVISTAVDSGLGKRQCLLSSSNLEEAQIKVFVSTILFILALSMSKCSILLFLQQTAKSSWQRLGLVAIGTLVLIWTLAAMAGTVFECEMPKPWEIWTGKCIPLVSWSYLTLVVARLIGIDSFLDYFDSCRHSCRCFLDTHLDSYGLGTASGELPENLRVPGLLIENFVG